MAVEFDAVAALQRAINLSTVAYLTAAAAASARPAVVTFAADWGAVGGKFVTAFTAGVSWPHLKHGRTDLVPLAYSLPGKTDVDHLVAAAVRDKLAAVLDASFTVSTSCSTTNASASEGSDDGDNEAGKEEDMLSRVAIKLCDEVQVCGTLACVCRDVRVGNRPLSRGVCLSSTPWYRRRSRSHI